MSAQHTPGPWEVRASKDTVDFGIIVRDERAEAGWAVIAEAFSEVRFAGERAPEAVHNARLIAAAPDLLEAAKQAEKWIAQQMEENWPADRVANPPAGSHLFNLRAAIAKATGSAA